MHLVPPARRLPQEELLHQPRQQCAVSTKHAGSRFQVEASTENTGLPQHLGLSLAQQCPRLVEDRAHTSVPAGHVPLVGREQIKVVRQFLCNLLARTVTHPYSRQLNRKGQPLYRAANARYPWSDLLRQDKASLQLSRSLGE